MIGARLSERLVHYFGTTRVIAGGLLLMAGTLPLLMLWQADSPYWLIGAVLVAVGFGVGNVAAPSVDAIMGAVPEAKAGVASATNLVNPDGMLEFCLLAHSIPSSQHAVT